MGECDSFRPNGADYAYAAARDAQQSATAIERRVESMEKTLTLILRRLEELDKRTPQVP